MTKTGSAIPTHSLTLSLSHSLRGVVVGFIGCGTMGQALIGGLRAKGVPASLILAADANRRTLQSARRRFGIRTASGNGAVVRRADVLVLAVKPQQFPDVISQIAPLVGRRQLVISIAAGVTLRWLGGHLHGVPLVRVMPNVPATVGCGFSAIAFGRGVTTRQRAVARTLCEAVGEVVELPERQFDAITAVSGSGPAYVFLLVHVWQQAARALGLPDAIAVKAIRQTLEGSVRLLTQSPEDAVALIAKVASKGGTTEAALKVFAGGRLAAVFRGALKAAARRSRSLSWS